MDKRLEEIKQRFKAMNELPSFKKLAPTELFFDDLDYLIQQAEVSKEWQIVANNTYADLIKAERRVKELEDKTNQRYKKALEFYADEENYEPLNMEVGAMTKDGYKVAKYRSEPKIEMDKGQKARQALEGDKP